MAFAFNVRSPISVPVWPMPVVPKSLSDMSRHAWFATLLIALGSPHASAQGPAPPSSREQPGFSRIIVSPEGPVTFQGIAGPGDRIVLRFNGRQTAETRADAHGQWRLQLAGPLQPGDHTVTAIAVAPGSEPARISEDVRIAIPEAAIPNYTESEDGPNLAAELGPPNAETRRLAAELAREASREFSKLTAGKVEGDKSPTPAADEPGKAADASGVPDTPASPDLLQPSHWFAAVSAWLVRSQIDYNEILVAGLSDPERRRGNDVSDEDTPVDGPPLPDRSGHAESRIASLFTLALGWLQRANRDYHEYVVRELALRGIEDPQERQIARSAASAPDDITAPPGKNDVEAEPSPPGLSREAEDQRIAEVRRDELAEARREEGQRAAEEQRLADERAAEERERQRGAAEAEAREHQLTEAQRRAQEQKQEQQRQQLDQRAEKARIARALETHLVERARQSRSAAGDTNRAKPPAGPDGASVQHERAMPEAAEPLGKVATQSDPAIPDPPKAGVTAVVPLPPRIVAAESLRVAVVIPSRNERRVARLQQKASQPPLPSRAREKLRDPPLPTRAHVMPLQPPLPEPLRARPAIAAKRDAPRSAMTARRAPIIARPARRPGRAPPRSRDRPRWCKSPTAGRTITPPGIYIVAYGDTLWDIAERHYGAGYLYRRIQRANRRKIARSSRIYPCQRIWLPRMKRHRH